MKDSASMEPRLAVLPRSYRDKRECGTDSSDEYRYSFGGFGVVTLSRSPLSKRKPVVRKHGRNVARHENARTCTDRSRQSASGLWHGI